MVFFAYIFIHWIKYLGFALEDLTVLVYEEMMENINCPVCKNKSIKPLKLFAEREVECEICKSFVVPISENKQYMVLLLLILLCGIAVLWVYFMPIAFFCVYLGVKYLFNSLKRIKAK